ncbi:SNF2 family N-terminal domain-containing protein [Thamnocephalis sphaerospora]|uniref:SNF2 family N-terminal domain-containing protein n=1 Tax=Thamnocephalis sphaerospora TaxID=78915 RepID=A0A4P9XTR8_9FUNG|nr:SNF2 family N-terminal domain-containing protein [Thamnocephalis sphaerospora]|eukprot:RKP08830.1 SNF2 family N-terminal domain-containing protein [Thamnocephalis sphaerospora]
MLNPTAFAAETPRNSKTESPFRTTPFGTPNRTTVAKTPKRDTEKDIRDLLANIVDDTSELVDSQTYKDPRGLTVQLLEHQKLGVAWMRRQEEGQYNGGILADDMGLGKTVQSIALMLANPSPDRDRKTTLILAPLAVIRQWEAECKSKADKGRLSVYVYHGARRITDPQRLQSFDVVVTTYNTVVGEFPRDLNGKMSDETIRKALEKGEGVGALFRTEWYRVVLGKYRAYEAQNIKNRSTRTAIASRHLKAQKRWCLSGTPIQNNLDELFSLFHFLHHPMFPDYVTFRAKVTSCLATDYDKTMKRLQVILKSIMLRRTKNSTINGKPLLSLPERVVEHVEVTFSEKERTLYNALEAKMKRNVTDVYQGGQQRGTFAIMVTALLRLRQACNHISLIDQALLSEKDRLGLAAAETSKSDSSSAIVPDPGMGDLMDAFKTLAVEQSRVCAVCFEPYVRQWTLDEYDRTHCEDCAKQFQTGANSESVRDAESAKVRQMIRELRRTRDQDPAVKTIVFSQFTSMLDLVEKPLRKHGFKYVRYDGSMRNTQREQVLQQIREDPETTIMLVSLLCGSTGLNLICASRVILLDVWWNPAIEEQAIDRVHRIGQKRPVHVTKITVADTVEKRIVELQEKKVGIFQRVPKTTRCAALSLIANLHESATHPLQP